ncbi:CHRD domain-containing protein [Desertibaculum subflavum]|uniref:CHRD domain-containing protein n=1 Tax=Desertibaculum subflavum TaxID=2268458 RepID=UPI000E66DB3D
MKLAMACVLTGFLLASLPRAEAAPIAFTAVLGPENEVPAVLGSSGTGDALVELDVVAHTMRVVATFSGLTGTVTVAHIHAPGLPGVNAGVTTQLPTFVGFPAGVTSGSYDMTFDTTMASTWNAAFITANGGTPLGAEAALLTHLLAGAAYFNVHTSFVGSGEIRGNFSAVPEPASGLLLLGLGLAAIVLYPDRSRR